ncbi:PAS domain S-box-containing protein [Breoghania corrubedonensis]|uniref:PAS domain S-box-containing protein n=2 Tax=Breoghania corrubedonensis TaxID=665038 RepID=A0A2T5VGM3_9HYPH|nr:PAS domain S-box protein [Breoghania corrubedonensis]PTW62888.1 PAS domain S-box-containing protein [Breoghania corrubedonensis]
MEKNEIAIKLLEGMPDAVVVCDQEGIIRFWNAGAQRIFGFSESEALGQSLDIIIPENTRERHWTGYAKTMRTGKTVYGAGDLLSVPAVRKNGTRISVQFSIVPFQDETGNLTAIAAIMRDVTLDFEERKLLRQALREARS